MLEKEEDKGKGDKSTNEANLLNVIMPAVSFGQSWTAAELVSEMNSQ